ncbi:DinB family protein [[Mycobacterium] nativiensis]|uniref:DinB family protein n=1 Tax=[Mycobacterium] nativiensis TaxID=2855503 RepID=A0ABU5XX13_9MYCO|nr:DinB family protein [Mycolicibacter sp. MYC340]MEB3032016.1 DinB family protein [Mycolicibacter sp. MYC340]
MPVTSELLAEQLDWIWCNQLRPRLDGLTDHEYLWEPVPDCWTVHRGGIDFAFPAPEPAPFTTIAWRMVHVTVGVFAMRNHHHFGGPPADYGSWPYAVDAATALHQLDDAYQRWNAGVRGLDEAALARPIGAAEGPWADRTMAELILHINREAIHHGAEIACIRDLYAHQPDRKA